MNCLQYANLLDAFVQHSWSFPLSNIAWCSRMHGRQPAGQPLAILKKMGSNYWNCWYYLGWYIILSNILVIFAYFFLNYCGHLRRQRGRDHRQDERARVREDRRSRAVVSADLRVAGPFAGAVFWVGLASDRINRISSDQNYLRILSEIISNPGICGILKFISLGKKMWRTSEKCSSSKSVDIP